MIHVSRFANRAALDFDECRCVTDFCCRSRSSSLPRRSRAGARTRSRRPLSRRRARARTGQAWQIVPQPQSSLVYARDGSLIGEIGRESRTSVPIRTLPKYVGQAFVAVEDQRFYQHDGVDLIGVAGAIKGKMLEGITGDHRGGASTITQQLVGNMHPDQIDRRDMSLARKLREQQAAREMERHYTKEQILEAYINQINFGHGWYGVESAARHYFGKNASRLTLAEAATLAALPKSPVGYDPIALPRQGEGAPQSDPRPDGAAGVHRAAARRAHEAGAAW